MPTWPRLPPSFPLRRAEQMALPLAGLWRLHRTGDWHCSHEPTDWLTACDGAWHQVLYYWILSWWLEGKTIDSVSGS